MAVWEPINGVYMATTPFLASMGWLGDWANSPLSSAVIGGMIGAGFGAWAAGWIAKRSKLYDSINEEIRSNNLAMLLAQQTFHLALSLKVDAVKPITDGYERARSECLDPSNGSVSERQNLQKVSPVNPPTDALRTIALERLTLPGSATRAVLQIVESISNLNRALTDRNELTDVFMNSLFPSGMDFHHMYFGIPKGGVCNAAYRDCINNMKRYADEALFFSMTLCELLHEHGVYLRKERKKVARGRVSILSFRLADDIPEGIIPDAKIYSAWFAGYELQTNPKRRWSWGKN